MNDLSAAFPALATPIVNEDGSATDAFIEFIVRLLSTDTNASTAWQLADLVDNSAEVLEAADAADGAAVLAVFADIS